MAVVKTLDNQKPACTGFEAGQYLQICRSDGEMDRPKRAIQRHGLYIGCLRRTKQCRASATTRSQDQDKALSML